MIERKIIMIKSVNLKPFTRPNPLPAYTRWQGLTTYTLKATVSGDYEILLAVLTIGKSKSGKNELSHVLFEGYDDHGKKMAETRIRAGGYEREFMAVTNAIAEAGIVFDSINPSSSVEEIMMSIGEWYKLHNSEIQNTKIIRQNQ